MNLFKSQPKNSSEIPNEPSAEKSESSFKEFVVFALLTIVIVLPIRLFVAQPFIVNGESMLPTFQNGQYLIVDELTYRFRSPDRGEVIIFRFPNDPSKFFIKRVIGLPGETIELIENDVFITSTDGSTTILLEEEYIELQKNNDSVTILEDDEYFVMGDNRLASLDSRIWGPLGEDFVVGRALVRLLPFSEIGVLPGNINFENE